jgi:hypothetical protein
MLFGDAAGWAGGDPNRVKGKQVTGESLVKGIKEVDAYLKRKKTGKTPGAHFYSHQKYYYAAWLARYLERKIGIPFIGIKAIKKEIERLLSPLPLRTQRKILDSIRLTHRAISSR